ncbi:MAG: hypothetical protein U1E65_20065 [Myxococcota bacterium]
MGRSRLLLGLALGIVYGCGPQTHIWTLEHGYFAAALIVTDDRGAARVVETHGPSDADTPFRFSPGRADRALSLVGLSEAEVLALGHDLEPGGGVQFSLTPTECLGPDASRARLVAKLPSSFLVLHGAVDAAQLAAAPLGTIPDLAELSLSVPLAVDRCRSSRDETLHPFGPTLELLQPGQRLGPAVYDPDDTLGKGYGILSAVASLDVDHALVAAYGGAYLVERGQGILADRSFIFTSGPGFSLRAMVPRPDTQPAVQRFTAVGDAPSLHGIVVDLAVTSTGVTVTSSVVVSRPLRALRYDARGRLLAVGLSGYLLVRDGGQLSAHTLKNYNLDSLALTGDPAAPLLAGTEEGVALIGDLEGERYEERSILRTEINLPIVSIALVGSGVWLGTDAGRLFRGDLRSTTFSEQLLGLPDSAVLCARGTNACGTFPAVRGSFFHLLPIGDSVLMVAGGCSGLVSFRGDPLCPRGYLSSSEGTMQATGESWRYATRDGDRVLVVGDGMRMAEIVGWGP